MAKQYKFLNEPQLEGAVQDETARRELYALAKRALQVVNTDSPQRLWIYNKHKLWVERISTSQGVSLELYYQGNVVATVPLVEDK